MDYLVLPCQIRTAQQAKEYFGLSPQTKVTVYNESRIHMNNPASGSIPGVTIRHYHLGEIQDAFQTPYFVYQTTMSVGRT